MTAERIQTVEDLEEADRAVLAAVMTGQLHPGKVACFPWWNRDARQIVAAVMWLRRRWADDHTVRQVIRIDGAPVALEDVPTHPGRERATVGLEVLRMDVALEAVGCDEPQRINAWATAILRDYRAAVAPDLDDVKARHAERDAMVAAVDLANAYNSNDARGVREALLRIREAVL